MGAFTQDLEASFGLSTRLHRFPPRFRGSAGFFHRGFFRNGVWTDGWWGPAVVTSAWWGGDGGCWTYRPVYESSGAYLGYSYVNGCW